MEKSQVATDLLVHQARWQVQSFEKDTDEQMPAYLSLVITNSSRENTGWSAPVLMQSKPLNAKANLHGNKKRSEEETVWCVHRKIA